MDKVCRCAIILCLLNKHGHVLPSGNGIASRVGLYANGRIARDFGATASLPVSEHKARLVVILRLGPVRNGSKLVVTTLNLLPINRALIYATRLIRVLGGSLARLVIRLLDLDKLLPTLVKGRVLSLRCRAQNENAHECHHKTQGYNYSHNHAETRGCVFA